jgi:hypothetical protein
MLFRRVLTRYEKYRQVIPVVRSFYAISEKNGKIIYVVCEVIYRKIGVPTLCDPLDETAPDIRVVRKFKTHETHGNDMTLFNVLLRTRDSCASRQYKMIVLHFTEVYTSRY